MKLVFVLWSGVSQQTAEKICTKESCPDQSHHPLLSDISQTSQKSFMTLWPNFIAQHAALFSCLGLDFQMRTYWEYHLQNHKN